MKTINVKHSIIMSDSSTLSLLFKDIYKYKPLTQEEEYKLATEHTKKSLEKLALHNMRFVITVAKQYQNQGLPLEDLISEGFIGLQQATEKFDPNRGFKFISYAVWWIRQAIISAIYSKGRTIRNTTDFITAYNKLNKETEKFIDAHGHMPSDEELSEILDKPVEKINEIRSRYKTIISLETPISEDGGTGTLNDVVSDNYIKSPDNDLEEDIKHNILHKIIDKLPEREKIVLINHLGLFGEFPKPFEEIGSLINVSGERARQIYMGSIRRLKERYGDKLKQILS